MGWQESVFTTIIIESGVEGSGLFVYSGAPANGNLIAAISATSGTDPYGNAYYATATFGDTADAFMQITPTGQELFYTSGGLGDLLMSLAPTGGTDQFGNTFPAGLRWNSPVQTMPAMQNGWSVGGHATYALDPLGNLVVSWKDLFAGTDTDGTVIWAAGSLPSAYQPPNNRRIACYTDQLRVSGTTVEGPALEIEPDGSVQCYGIAGGATRADLFAVIPLAF